MTRVKKITAIVSAILMLGTIIYQVNAYTEYDGDAKLPVVAVDGDVEGVNEGNAYLPESAGDSEEITLGYFEDDNVDGIVLGEFEDADGDGQGGYIEIEPFITPPPSTGLEFVDTTTNTFKHVQIHVPTLPTPNSQIGISIAPDVVGVFRVGDVDYTVLIGDIIPENWEILSWRTIYHTNQTGTREFAYTVGPFGDQLIHTLPEDICLVTDWWVMMPTFRVNLRAIPATLSGTVTCVTCPEREEGVPGLPMPGVLIHLYNEEGDLFGSETTDENGFFDFGEVPFGDFELVKVVDTVPEGHLSIEPQTFELTIATPAGEYEEHFFVECKEPPTLEKEATLINGEPIEEGQLVVEWDVITYRLRVYNPNPRAWSNFLLVDELPAGLSLIGMDQVIPETALMDNLSTGNTLRVLLNLPPGYTNVIFLAIVDDVTLAVDGDFVNIATLYGPPDGGGERPPIDRDREDVPVRPPSISLDKSVYPPSVDPGEVVTYTLVVRNTGGAVLTNVVVIDDLPTELTQPRNLVITPTDAGSGSFVGQRLTVTIPRLVPGEEVTITFDATVSADAVPGYTIDNVAEVTTDQNVSDEDEASVYVSVPRDFRPPGISLEKSVSAGTVQAGGNLTYTIVVRNLGDEVLTNVAVRDELPSQLTNPRNLAINPANAGTGSFVGQVLTVTISELGIDQVVTITFDVTVAPGVANNTVIRNVASVTTDQGPSAQDDARVTVGAPRQPGPLTGDDGILGSLMFMFVVGGTMLVMMSLIKAEKKKIRKK